MPFDRTAQRGVLLPRQRDAWRDEDGPARCERDGPLIRGFLPRDVLRPPGDDGPRGRGARLLCDDVLLLAWTLLLLGLG